MATNFPTSLQDLDATRGTSGQPLSSPNHATHHQTEDDTIEALQAKVGIDNSADTTSLDYKLKSTSSLDPGHKHSEAALTLTDVTTNNATTSNHGFLKKLSNVVTEFMRGDGSWAAIQSASDTTAGISELATIAETSTGTDAARTVTPDGLSGSIYGQKSVSIPVLGGTTDMTTGDGQAYFTIPSNVGGMDLIGVHARVVTAGTTGTCSIQIANVTQGADMLTTKITIDSAETGSDTAATAPVIDTANDDVATNDLIRIDIDTIHTTPAKGLIVALVFKTP